MTKITASDIKKVLMRKDNVNLISVGNIEDDLDKAGACDWICEAIVERLDIKRQLYANLLPHLKPTTLVSSNTSTIPIKLLVEESPQDFKERFCITHFFNPVRYMRLLELVRGEETRDDVTALAFLRFKRLCMRRWRLNLKLKKRTQSLAVRWAFPRLARLGFMI